MNIIQFLSLHEVLHLASSVIIGILLWKIYRNWLVVIVSIFVGIMIDADHLFDYLLHYLTSFGLAINLERLTNLGDYFSVSGKVYVPLHSLDLVWIWWFVGRKLNRLFRARGLEWAIILSVVMHVLIDYASYMPHPLAYFFFFRIANNFSQKSFDGL